MKFLASAVVLLTPTLALAHEGHGATPGTSLLHWMLEPAHFPVVAVGAALAAAAIRRVARGTAR